MAPQVQPKCFWHEQYMYNKQPTNNDGAISFDLVSGQWHADRDKQSLTQILKLKPGRDSEDEI